MPMSGHKLRTQRDGGYSFTCVKCSRVAKFLSCREFREGALNSVASKGVHIEEASLVERAAAGDRDARSGLFEQCRDAAFRVALQVAGNHEDALDIVQDGFIRAFEKLPEFQRGASFRTWLLRIVHNRALDVLRRRKVRLAQSLDAGEDDDRPNEPAGRDADAQPGRRMELAEAGDAVRRAIERLPAEQRTVFELYASGELTYGEIAEMMGIPIGTVMSRLFHARRVLRERLAELGPEGSTSR